MSNVTYVRYELLRTLRNRRFFIFSLAFPLVMFFLVGGSNSGTVMPLAGISFTEYYMVSMAGWGAMMSVLAGGARISTERQAGWIRQLRVTPLTTSGYFRSKVVTSYVMALLSMVLLYSAGIALGVRLPLGNWAQMSGLILVGLVPFAALGVVMGHLLSPDSMGPALGGIASLFAFLGGSWFPLDGWLKSFGEWLPSYWLVQAGRTTILGGSWSPQGWLVVAAWAAVMTVLAGWAYRRDGKRVT
ncbi:MAG: ABC transporter permease [Nocardioidaceae bacterium]